MIEMPEWAQPLFQPARYKVAHGGRGSGKSWAFATALLLQGASEQHNILCAREVQKSIKQSVHQLLSDRIVSLGLEGFYQILETEIRGKNGTTISFAGLQAHTVDSIKSFEGVTRCWVEEAQSVSKRSWDVLTPTIRRPGSEIWITMNPLLDTDETWTRFVLSPPPNSWVREVNFVDNPWFSEELEQERLHCERTRPDDYDNIWLGKTKAAVEGAIYAREVEEAQREGRVCLVPYDPKLKVHTVWDLGWNDSMTVSFVQRVRGELRIIDYIEDSHRTLDSYVAEAQARRYNFGFDFLPHDGWHKDFKTGKSAAEILKAFGRKVRQVPKDSVEGGIKAARMTFPSVVFNAAKTERLLECLKRYRRTISTTTNEPGAPLHDEYSHGADNFRYIALCAEQMTNESEQREAIRGFEPLDAEMGF